jgi:hypothetical protein
MAAALALTFQVNAPRDIEAAGAQSTVTVRRGSATHGSAVPKLSILRTWAAAPPNLA